MSGLDYVREEEVAQIPVLDRKVKHLVYGPLSDLPMDPDIVLLFAHAQQGLIISEAVQRVDKNMAPAMGRPACAVIPQVMNNGKAAVSLGCCGARSIWMHSRTKWHYGRFLERIFRSTVNRLLSWPERTRRSPSFTRGEKKMSPQVRDQAFRNHCHVSFNEVSLKPEDCPGDDPGHMSSRFSTRRSNIQRLAAIRDQSNSMTAKGQD